MNRRQFLQLLATALASLPFSRYARSQAQTPPPPWIIPPTCLHVSPTEAYLFGWLEAQVTGGTWLIRDAATAEVVQEVALDPATTYHTLHLTDLKPATLYQYTVDVGGSAPLYFDEVWPAGQFRTPDPAAPIRFLAIGDSGYGESVTTQLIAHMTARPADFLLHLGDMVYYSNQYDNNLPLNWREKYYQPFAPLLATMPHYATVGNHDNESSTRLNGERPL